MKIGVTSQNPLKVEAVRHIYLQWYEDAEVIAYSVDSGVNEQPEGQETWVGARNRIANLDKEGLDRIVSIESGIFFEEGRGVDRAVVVVYCPETNREFTARSGAVPFPAKYVNKAMKIGFDNTTVGKVMQEAGVIKDAQDPHLDLMGVSRQKYLESAVAEAVRGYERAYND